MKPIYVALIAIASALAGGLIGASIGGVAGGVAGGAGGTAIGFKYGICTATDIAKAQKLLSPAQAEQLSTQAYAQVNRKLAERQLQLISSQDCQTTIQQVDSLAK
jgi:isopentenyl diphosphate isomerase/L-lactate dehydrogenase-like FMN-dependent dehydrogenase